MMFLANNVLHLMASTLRLNPMASLPSVHRFPGENRLMEKE
jgi:hypothetical protein